MTLESPFKSPVPVATPEFTDGNMLIFERVKNAEYRQLRTRVIQTGDNRRVAIKGGVTGGN